MRRIDELHLELPFYGSRRMTFELNKEGRGVNRKRVRRLTRVMGIRRWSAAPARAKPRPGTRYTPTCRAAEDCRADHVWAADVTYIPMACGFLYLVAIIDWASRAVLAWRLSNTNDASFCAAALEEALLRFGKPRIFNTDQGSTIHRRGFHQQACDGRRRDFDGRTWPLHGQHFHRTAVAVDQVRRSASESLRRWLRGAVRHQFLDELYNFRRPHQAMSNQMPMAVWRAGMDKIEAAARAVDMPLRLDNANALPTYPQQKPQEAA